MTGLSAYGAYIPRLRLQRKAILAANSWHAPSLAALAKGERAICHWDEDSVTMAVEAARDTLGNRDRGDIAAVYFASTTPPFADRQNAGIIAEALNLPDTVQTLDIGGSQRAGLSALIAGLQTAAASAAPVLVVSADQRKTKPGSEGEMTYGDGAAAVLVGGGASAAKPLALHSEAIDFVDHFRESGAPFDYAWESRWVRDEGWFKLIPPAIGRTLEKAGLGGNSINHFCLPTTIRGAGNRIAKWAGIPEDRVRDTLQGEVGECGTAHALVMLAHALEQAQPGETIMVAGFGNGVDVVIVEATAAIAAAKPAMGVSGFLQRRTAEENYFKYLAFNGLIDIEKGMRAETDDKPILSSLYRNRKAVLGLIGGRCTETGVVQFPRSRISVNPQQETLDTQEDYPMADLPAKVMTYTADNLVYSANPPAVYGMITFEEGGRMTVDFTDVDADTVDVGMPMRMVFRIKNHDDRRGFTRYFWKATPAYTA